MPQQHNIKPFFLNLDSSYEELKPSESPFIKGLTFDINGNPNSGTNNGTGEGQNMMDLTTMRSNAPVADIALPDGNNMRIGYFESPTTQEGYWFNYNSQGSHGVYLIDGNTGGVSTVIIDPELNFSDEPENFTSGHRVLLRYSIDAGKNITEKYLLITDGYNWHKNIPVTASVKTNGFNAAQYPYWTLMPPHFDRRELFEWAVRPPMERPIVSQIPNTAADAGSQNMVVDRAFQFAISNENTDGMKSVLSPYSLPFIVKSELYLNSPDSIPKRALLKFPAGSPKTEKISIYVRLAKRDSNSIASIKEWGDWFLYETIYKYDNLGANSPQLIGGDYWLRTNPWSGYNYDAVFNTIEYVFDNKRVYQIISQGYANLLQTGMPQLSVAMTDLGDAAILGNNRYLYDNFGQDVLGKMLPSVAYKPQSVCQKPVRELTLYAYVGRCGDNFAYIYQFGWINGEDKNYRFGGWDGNFNDSTQKDMANESRSFGLDFADKKGFRCYLKGTPYYADAIWCEVKSDFSVVEIDGGIDIGKDGLSLVTRIREGRGFIVAKFRFTVPSDRYIATIGRHSVPSSGNYIDESTYIYGVANSRNTSQTAFGTDGILTVKPNAIVSFSKEIEVDLTQGDVDVWGNNADLFYIYCPYITKQGNKKYRFIEGYFKEKSDAPKPVELFPYQMSNAATDDCGQFTDKNGFYWAYTKVANADSVSIDMYPKINCVQTKINIATSQGGIGWMKNADAYLASYNGGAVGDCNRIIYKGKVTDLTGGVPYSNIAISMKDGPTVYTKQDGTFEMTVHNGMPTLRTSAVYVNSGGGFSVTGQGCSQLPVSVFDEANVACISCQLRVYPIQLNLQVNINTANETSLADNGSYSVVCYGADLAGRLMYANRLNGVSVPSFLVRNNLLASYLTVALDATLDLSAYPDIKWFTFGVSANLSAKRRLQWVGDSIEYIDNAGNSVSSPSAAVFCAIKINSLFDANVSNNLDLLSTYQFVKEDRLRVFGNGKDLFDVATYGDPIDVQVLGTNYTQAAINSGLIPPQVNTVLTSTPAASTDISLIVKYDQRFDKLLDKTGFWIEVYTPSEQSELVPFYETAGFYPVVNGKISQFTGYNNGVPVYAYPTSLDIEYWDTYFLQRFVSIPGSGSRYFPHHFESANITDYFGFRVSSGGRIWVENRDAKQYWSTAGTAKSDDFARDGLVNGLNFFSNDNKRDFSAYPYGGITAMKSAGNILLFCCENDYFTTDYNYRYTYANPQGAMVVNLDNGLSTPHQKTSNRYGLSKEHTDTFVTDDGLVFWLDAKNSAFIKCDYRSAVDISQLTEGEMGGIQSWLNSKLGAVQAHNATVPKGENGRKIDMVCGVDSERGHVYITFRPRRRMLPNPLAFVNTRRAVSPLHQETIVYSIQYRGWIGFCNFCPEGYGRLRGNFANVEMLTFRSGLPYAHNNTPNGSFLNYYGVQTQPVLVGVFNGEKAIVKAAQRFCINSLLPMWADMVYTKERNSFSYVPVNMVYKKENMYYAAFFRDMNSYPPVAQEQLYLGMLLDGKRVFGTCFIVRFVGDILQADRYNQINSITLTSMHSGTTRK